ncbi:FecR family protein [Castellaniella sp.]|uniref:FecR family protein n=1 Tax=Castellaniella sp. TaxID=1955812 RepID=UPI002AFF2E7B|nr:FecR domain-containing protein [Castellaniella sp.]
MTDRADPGAAPRRQNVGSGADPFMPFEDVLRARLPSREEILREAKAQSAQRRLRRRQAIASAGVVLCAGLWAWNPVLRERTVAVGAGAPSAWTARDGTVVALDSRSMLTMQWRLRTRDMRLDAGQVVLTVAQNWRPLRVRVGDAVVRDIGTVFRVRRDAAGAQVAVLQGRVEVSSPAGQTVLDAGQAADVGTLRAVPASVPVLERETAWREGRLRFDGTPLSDVLVTLSHYRPAPVVWAGDPPVDTDALRLSGEYRIRDLESLIDSLPSVLPVRIERQPDGVAQVFLRSNSKK